MNFFKRALASVTRRKGKSIILFAVVFILGNVIAGSISIQQATKSVEKNIKSQLGGTATITLDYERYEKDMKDKSEDDESAFESVKLKEIEAIGALPYVKYYDYSLGDYPETNKLKMYQPDSEEGQTYYSGSAGSNHFNLKGVNYPKVTDIEEKKIALRDGRVFEQSEIDNGKSVILISNKLAEANNLKVGDTLVIDATGSNEMGMMGGDSEDNSEEDGKKIERFVQDQAYEVIGIFTLVQQEKSKKKDERNNNMGMDQEFMDTEQYNTMYAPNKIVFENQKNYRTGLVERFPELKEMYGSEDEDESEFDSYLTPFYMLKTPEDSEPFREEATPLLANKYNKVLLSTDQYDSIAAPVKNMSKIATYVIIVSVAATLLIISLVVLLFLRDRKHELGVYLSLGEKRTKVIGQVVIEVALIAFVAISLSVFTGNILAKGVSGSLMATQMKAEEDKEYMGGSDDWYFMQLTGNKVGNEEVADSYEVSLSLGYIISFYLVGIGTVLLSTIVPLIYILRLNPKKIMM